MSKLLLYFSVLGFLCISPIKLLVLLLSEITFSSFDSGFDLKNGGGGLTVFLLELIVLNFARASVLYFRVFDKTSLPAPESCTKFPENLENLSPLSRDSMKLPLGLSKLCFSLLAEARDLFTGFFDGLR